MDTNITLLLCILSVLQTCFAPPVSETKAPKEQVSENDLEYNLEYHRYLQEVVKALESDPGFKEKLEKANEDEVRSGKIADELDLVAHHVRTQLDELKRIELERLKELTMKRRALLKNEVGIDEDPTHYHLDQSNPHTFEVRDLKNLISKTRYDVEQLDIKRKEEFKRYEMEKEYKRQDKLNHTSGEERAKLEKEYEEMMQKHKKHEKLHEPGHEAQLEEVWEKQDHMQQQFDPKTFFMLHDIDSNGLWDEMEVKALFTQELDKMYQQGLPEDDMRERIEEQERMAEAVFKEADLNGDRFIDFNEFLASTKRQEFKQDHGWQGIDENRPYTNEELDEYIRRNHSPQGYYPQHPGQMPGYPQGQVPPGYQVPQGYQLNQVPQQPYQHVPQGYQQGQGQIPQGYQQQQGQIPQGYQQQQGHVPQQGYQQGQHPQGQMPQQHPQGYQQGQVPQQHPQGYQQGQVPQQHPQGQVPQQHPQGYQQGQQAHPQGQVPQHVPQGHQQGQVPQQGPPQGYQPVQGNAIPKNPNIDLNNLPPLNTNEVYPNQPNHQAQNQQNLGNQIPKQPVAEPVANKNIPQQQANQNAPK